jgi:hypothetical protein
MALRGHVKKGCVAFICCAYYLHVDQFVMIIVETMFLSKEK